MKPIPKLIMAASLLAMTLPAQSAILWDSLVNDTINFYEDQSRESIFDRDGNGAVSAGDVFVGYLRLDDRSVPLPGQSVTNDLYAVFSLMVDTFTPIDNGDGTTTYNFNYSSTSNIGDGLSLQELTGDANAVGNFTAVYEDVGANLISTSPGDVDGDGRLTIFDFIAEITNDTLDLIAGIEIDGVDH